MSTSWTLSSCRSSCKSAPHIHILISPGVELIDRLGFAPVYFSAFVYIVLGMAINRIGQQYSILTPKMVSLSLIG